MRCHYNLRLRPAAGNCPECGLPLTRSVRACMLAGYSPRQLRRLRQSLLSLVGGIVVICVAVWVSRLSLYGHDVVATVELLLTLAAVLLVARGWLGLAPGNRLLTLSLAVVALRRTARVGMVFGSALFVLTLALERLWETPSLVLISVTLIPPLAMCLAVLHFAISTKYLIGRVLRLLLVGIAVYVAISLAAWAVCYSVRNAVASSYAVWPEWFRLLSWVVAALGWNMLLVAGLAIWLLAWLRRCLGRALGDRIPSDGEPRGAGRA